MKKTAICLTLFLLTHVLLNVQTTYADKAEEKSFDPLPGLYKLANSNDETLQWKSLSLIVQIQRSKENYKELNIYLNKYLSRSGSNKVKPRIHYWIAENYIKMKDYKNAVTAFKYLIKKYKKSNDTKQNWALRSKERLVDIYRQGNENKKAEELLKNIIEKHRKEIPEAWFKYKLAMLYLKSNKRDYAINTLKEIARKHKKEKVPNGQELVSSLAKYNALALQQGKIWYFNDPLNLAKKLAKAVNESNSKKLITLARPYNFFVSTIGSEATYRQIDKVEDILEEALSKSKPFISVPKKLDSNENKLYIFSDGWNDGLLSSGLYFVLVKRIYGWEWGGLALTKANSKLNNWALLEGINSNDKGLLTSMLDNIIPNAYAQNHPPDGQPLPFTLLAPWKADRYMASGTLGSVIVGTKCADTFGLMGYYYGEGGHVGDRYYAIDFNKWGTSWELCFLGILCPHPFPKGGVEVRSVAAGIVTAIDPDNGQVTISHMNPGNNISGYTSIYAHMRDITVSQDDFVSRGSPLGRVSDVGEANGKHLHFRLNNNNTSVMPSRLDGELREHAGNVKCIKSTNNTLFVDSDGDSIPDAIDTCPFNPHTEDSLDTDSDSIDDVCDEDIDGDGILNDADLCPFDRSTVNIDSDGDGHGDPCDNCPGVQNTNQYDANNDGEGDACDSDDSDGDGIPDKDDECPSVLNVICHNEAENMIDVSKEALKARIIFDKLHKSIQIPLGPLCTSCPPEMKVTSEIMLVDVPEDIKIRIKDPSGKVLTSKRFSVSGKQVVRYTSNASQLSILEINPTSAAVLNKVYELQFMPDKTYLKQEVDH